MSHRVLKCRLLYSKVISNVTPPDNTRATAPDVLSLRTLCHCCTVPPTPGLIKQPLTFLLSTLSCVSFFIVPSPPATFIVPSPLHLLSQARYIYCPEPATFILLSQARYIYCPKPATFIVPSPLHLLSQARYISHPSCPLSFLYSHSIRQGTRTVKPLQPFSYCILHLTSSEVQISHNFLL